MTISIERATTADAEILVSLQIASFHYDSQLYPQVEIGGPPGYDSVESMLTKIQEDVCYKIVDDGRIVGGICLFEKSPDHYHLDVIFIAPAEQNRGIGTLAIHFIERTHPASHWSLDTPQWAVRNQHFYEKLGYVRGHAFVVEDGTPLFAYEKHIASHP